MGKWLLIGAGVAYAIGVGVVYYYDDDGFLWALAWPYGVYRKFFPTPPGSRTGVAHTVNGAGSAQGSISFADYYRGGHAHPEDLAVGESVMMPFGGRITRTR